MRTASRVVLLAVVATIAAISLTPAARADSQSNKNLWRNAAIAAGAATVYGLSKHQNTTSWLGAAGTAYSLKRYEDARHAQSVEGARRRAYYYRSYRPAGTSRYYTTNNYYYNYGRGYSSAHRRYTWHGRRYHRRHSGRRCR